jgi:hypothetical protein
MKIGEVKIRPKWWSFVQSGHIVTDACRKKASAFVPEKFFLACFVFES